MSGGSEGELPVVRYGDRRSGGAGDVRRADPPTSHGGARRVGRARRSRRPVVAGEGGRSTVTWSQLDETTADAVITTTIERFALLGVDEWEWEHYSYDRPRIWRGACWPPASRPSRPRR